MLIRFFIILLLFCFSFHTFGQEILSLEVLHQELKQTKSNQQAPILLKIAEQYWKEEQQDSAFFYAKSALNFAKKNKNKIIQHQINFKVGDFYRFKGAYIQAIEQYKTVTLENKDLKMVAKSNNAIGVCYYYIGSYEAALNFYLKSLELYKSISEHSEVARLNSNIGYIHLAIKNHQKALTYFITSANIYQQHNNLKGYISELNTIGAIYTELAQVQKAKTKFEQVLQLTDTLPDNLSRGAALHNLAEFVAQEGNHELALSYLLESVEIDKYHKRQDRIAESYLAIGLIYQKKGDFSKSEYHFQESWQLAKEQNALRELMEASGALITLYKTTQQYEKGYSYFEIYHELTDSLYNIEEVNAIQDFETKLDKERHQQEVEMLNRENALQRYISIWMGVGFLFITIALSLFGYSVWLRKKVWEETAKREKVAHALQQTQNKQLETELAFKNRELASIALQTYQKNERLAKIQQQLTKLKSTQYPASFNKAIDKIIKTLATNFQVEEEWNTFKLHFEKVHPDFFTTLQKQYSKLSQVELKQCAYIKIGLSSKEIARLININNSSVHMAHYRIKKKLELEKEVSLQDFIQKM